jgi:hypothetical protein
MQEVASIVVSARRFGFDIVLLLTILFVMELDEYDAAFQGGSLHRKSVLILLPKLSVRGVEWS